MSFNTEDFASSITGLFFGRAVAVLQDKVLTLFRELQQQNEGKVEFIIISTKLFHINHCHTAGVQ